MALFCIFLETGPHFVSISGSCLQTHLVLFFDDSGDAVELEGVLELLVMRD